MDLIQILGFVVITLLLVISPGPNGLLIAKTVATSGKKAGFANVAGFLAAFYMHGLLSVLGISVLLTKSADAFMVVKVLGAVYLAWIGIKSLISAFRQVDVARNAEATALNTKSQKPSSKSRLKPFCEGFLTNALNPKVSMFYLAAFPQFIPVGEHAFAYALLLVTLHSIMNMLWFSAMIMLFARLRTVGTSAIFQRLLKGGTGVIFLGFGAKLLALDPK